MHVVSRPIDAPVALYEEPRPGQCALRVLVFRTGLLDERVLRLLGRLLRNVESQTVAEAEAAMGVPSALSCG